MKQNLNALFLIGLVFTVSIAVFARAFNQQQKLTASDAAQNDRFGWSVALDGDTAVIGAYGHQVGGNNDQGAVYVYVRNGTTWSQQAKVTANDGAAEDVFGISVALDGDTMLVGARGDDIGAVDGQGSAYVFVRNGTTWTQQAKLTASDGAANSQFGNSVSLNGDSALVGAYLDEDQGAAYVYVRNGTTWTQQTKLIGSDVNAADQFGESVSLSGNTAVIGAPFHDIDLTTDRGAAYVFVRSGTTWTQQVKLIASDGSTTDEFGWSVTIDGNTALVGAWGDNIGANDDQGSAYVFARNGTTWIQVIKLTANEGDVLDNFGISIDLSADVAVIGAHREDNDQGAAYVFTRSGSSWTQHAKLTASDGADDDFLGWSVAASIDTVLAGAYWDDASAINQGSAYVFFDPVLIPTPTPTNTSDSPTEVPTRTPTPTLEPGTTELVQNGSFENLGSDGKPDVMPWIIKNPSGDKAKCNKDKDGDGIPDKIFAYVGDCAFQFKNVIGEAVRIQQNLDLSAIIPAVGDALNLSFYVSSKGDATVKAKVVFKYADDTKTKISVESSGAETYTEFTGSETLTSADIAKAKISFKSAQTSGKVFVDAVSLFHIANAGFIPLPHAQLGSSKQ